MNFPKLTIAALEVHTHVRGAIAYLLPRFPRDLILHDVCPPSPALRLKYRTPELEAGRGEDFQDKPVALILRRILMIRVTQQPLLPLRH